MTESDYFKSKQFQEDLRKQVEKDTWDKDLPMIYLDREGWIVKHYKNGVIKKIKKVVKEK